MGSSSIGIKDQAATIKSSGDTRRCSNDDCLIVVRQGVGASHYAATAAKSLFPDCLSTKVDKNKPSDPLANVPFPWKLHAMLEEATNAGLDHIASWERGGKAFKVHDSEQFVNVLLRSFFNQTRYKSFQRQLNMYGFNRVTKGRDKGLYYHKLFVRDQKALCGQMERHKIKNSNLLEPETIFMSQEEAQEKNNEVIMDLADSSGHDIIRLSSGGVEMPAVFEGRTFYLVDNTPFDVAPSPDPSISYGNKMPLTFDSTISEHNFQLENNTDKDSSTASKEKNSRSDSFPWKLHDMLSQVETTGQEHIVSWEHNGRALKVHKPQEFVTKILPNYFLHSTKWESFQRQLNLYGFTRVALGPLKGMYVHKYFMRERRCLCRHVTRPKKF